MGVVVENCHGLVVRSACKQVWQALDPPIIEAKVVVLVLQVALPCEPRRIVVECDCKHVVSMLKSTRYDGSYLGVVIREILSLVELFDYAEFVHVFRGANGPAHAMAQLDSRDYCTRVWMGECPEVVNDIIAAELCNFAET
ncbi:Pyruvate dehydrogenase E1 component subunit beta mitochondrial [Bienertia sinuspersici]